MSRRGRPRARVRADALVRLESIQAEYGVPALAREKSALARALARAPQVTAERVLRLHEALLFLRAYPDDRRVRAAVERVLSGFGRRADVRRFRAALADSGIAGTAIHYPFFQSTARWLAERWPRALAVDWDALDEPARLESLLPLFAIYSETPGLDEYDYGLRGWLARLKGPSETDASFLARRLPDAVHDDFAREKVWDGLDLPLVLSPGPGTPTRTHAHWPRARVAYQHRPLRRERPDLRAELARPPRAIRAVDEREGQRLIDLARAAMVTRSRDLDAFSYADPRDVRVVDCGAGLQFAAMGVTPERRLLLESVYGFLTLKNGVPIGYVLSSALFGSSEVAYNVFDTYRGAEAGAVYGRVLSMLRALFGSDAFTIFPYQLGGAGNHEGLASGAWWFYRKLGFRPAAPTAVRLMRREERRMAADPAHRSSLATLKRLGEENVYWHLGRPRRDVIGRVPIPNVGIAIMRMISTRFGAERRLAEPVCAAEAAARLGLPTARRGWSGEEELALARWAPLVLMLPGLARWTAAERRAFVEVIRAKGGRRESEFVRRFDSHAKLRAGLLALLRGVRT